MGIEMVKGKDIPYLGIVGHMLAVVSGEQEEYIGVVTLIICDVY